ncbi:UNVERIFIED_CONTAM: hypothetical protein K2H54_007264 [Gekko kuhli]
MVLTHVVFSVPAPSLQALCVPRQPSALSGSLPAVVHHRRRGRVYRVSKGQIWRSDLGEGHCLQKAPGAPWALFTSPDPLFPLHLPHFVGVWPRNQSSCQSCAIS